ncbi:MAG: type III secretion system chaperone [Cyanobacteria bacterium J06621_12]
MKKLWALLFCFAMAIALANFDSSGLLQFSATAQPAAEIALELMDIERLDAILQEQIGDISGQPGRWRFSLNDLSILVLADPNADRMRIFTPVADAAELPPEQMRRMMLANFHTALDARYAIADGIIVSTFIHPLSTLQEQDLLSALNQVSSLATTFGSSYTSGKMLFIPNGNRGNNRDDRDRENLENLPVPGLPQVDLNVNKAKNLAVL